MDRPELWRQADAILEQLLDLPADKRLTELDRLAPEAALRERVEQLLAAMDADGPLDSDPFVLAGQEALGDPEAGVGRTVGNYRLEAVIGSGGMSVVYRAIRVDGAFDAPVAVKMLNQALLATDWRQRFQREARLLSRLRHTAIAALIDAGLSDEGVPYLVAELVEGEPIDAWCARHRSGLRRRVGLLVELAEAIAHAQTRLIIHRDIKPANVLVSDDGQVKLLDFGIAKPVPDQTAPSENEAPPTRVYTPDYAAPEQLAGDVATTATDVYSLGVLAFRLLTGVLPGRPGGGEPPRASKVLAGELASAERSAAVEAISQSEIAARHLKGDLDNILARCLAADPAERYSNARALADDLKAWLDYRPVSARRTPLASRLARLVRRNPWASSMAGLALAAIVVALVLVVQAQWQLAQRAAELEAVAAFQSEALQRLDAEQLGSGLRQQLIDTLVEVRDLEAIEAAEAVAGVNFTNLAVGLIDRAILAPAVQTASTRFDDQPLVLAELLHNIASAHRTLGQPHPARAIQETAVALRRKHLGEGDELHLDAMQELVRMARQAGHDDALELAARLVAFNERYRGADHYRTWVQRGVYGVMLSESGDHDAGERVLEQVLDRLEALLGPDHRETNAAMGNLATALMGQGRFADAEVLAHRAWERLQLAPHPDPDINETVANNLAFVLRQLGRLDEAEAMYTETWESRRQRLGDAHPRTLVSLNNLAMVQMARQQPELAEPLIRQVYEGMALALGPNHGYTISLLNNLGGVNRDLGRLETALEYFASAADRARVGMGESHPTTARIMSNHVRALREVGRMEEASLLLEQAWQVAERSDNDQARRSVALEYKRYFQVLVDENPDDHVLFSKLEHWRQMAERLGSL